LAIERYLYINQYATPLGGGGISVCINSRYYCCCLWLVV